NCGAKRNKKARHAKMAGRQINGSNKQLNTFYLRPNRWRCAETLHVASVLSRILQYNFYDFWTNGSEVRSKNSHFCISGPVGGAALKHCM
ncbi:MAG: hypothetical protein ACRCTW_10435, partial [Lactococcus garvieae]